MIRSIFPTLAAVAGLLLATFSLAQESTFTYQGQLNEDGQPFDGTADLEFLLFDQLNGGSQVGSSQTLADWPVVQGLFQVELDFGSAVFDGDERFLEVRVDGVALAPRQRVTATPHALLAAGVAAGSVDDVAIDSAEVQLRVVGTCPSGEYVREVNQDGSVVCETAPDEGGTVTQVDTGSGLTGGPITETGTIAVAPNGIGAAEIDGSQVQRRVVGTCPSGEYVREVNQDGSVVCETAPDSGGTLTQVDTGSGLTGGPITETGTIAVAPNGIGSAEIDGSQVQRRVTGTCPSGEYLQVVNQDGSVTCGIDDIGSVGWGLSGNAGTNPATDFLGTTDGTPLEIRTGDARSLRLEPSAETFGSPAFPITINSIGGSHSNEVSVGVRGATIAGGGLPAGDSDPEFSIEAPNLVTDHFGTVGGGYGNQAGDATGNALGASHATIGGGVANTASGSRSIVGGGSFNVASGISSTIGGGDGNEASEGGSTVGGGQANNAFGTSSTVGGGFNNTASEAYATVGGGEINQATGGASTVSGGEENFATAEFSTVGGGTDNTASGSRSTVAGGILNTASGFESATAGGAVNMASGGWGAVGGGAFNTAMHGYSTVSGGRDNCAGGEYSWASGRRAKARPGTGSGEAGTGCTGVDGSGDLDGDNGTFVWADSQNVDFVSSGPDQFLVRAAGGAAINTSSPRAPLTVEGEGKWNPSIGNGFGDFHVGTEDYGLAIGVANGPGLGAGAVRFWPKGGNEAIVFTTASNHPDRTLTLSDDGLVGVRRNPASNALEVAGNASKTSAGSWLANSDARIKTGVEDISGALDRLMQVRPVTFRYAEAYRDVHAELDEARYYNVIAQEFARVFPNAVKGSGEFLPGMPETPDNEILQVDTHPAVITSIAAVQELAVRLEETEARNASLQAKLATMRRRQEQELSELRAELAALREFLGVSP